MFFKKKRSEVPAVLPKHISFIIDGNGRWAKKRGMKRTYGHQFGFEAVKKTVDLVEEYKIPFVSFYCFSTENWKREQEEIDGIFQIVREQLVNNVVADYEKRNIRLVVYGDINRFPEDLRESLADAIEKTKNNTGTTVILCLNYGGRDEILRAVNNILKSGKKEATLEDIEANLYSAGIPDPDFIVRTSGENRISNYMLYQCAYSEFYFPKILWPDFDRKYFVEALWEFASRNRRYGGIKK